MLRPVLALGIALVSGLGVAAQQPPGTPPKPTARVIHVPVPTEAPRPEPALRYALFVQPYDLVSGNAAPQWVRIGMAAADATRRVTPQEWDWASMDVPLDKLPRDNVHALLQRCSTSLRLADEAARCDRCDWELPLPTLQLIDLPLDEVGHLRNVARLLSLRCRLELSERRFDDAARTLRTGFTMARHAGEGPWLVQTLVGIAVAEIMLERVEEWMQLPGAPLLAWPLTALPVPLVSSSSAIRWEAGTFYRSFPRLRTLPTETLSREQANALATELLQTIAPVMGDQRPPDWVARLGMAAMATQVYPEAKRYLIAHGRTPEQVEAMPVLQAVLMFYTQEYNEIWDEILKRLSLPNWQAWPGLEAAAEKARVARATYMNVFVGLLMPAILKVRSADVRLQRHVAMLRCAEAIRHHAAEHAGRPPATLVEITSIPLPVDPLSGKGFDEFYKAEDDRAVLDVPAMPHQPVGTGRRFEFTPAH